MTQGFFPHSVIQTVYFLYIIVPCVGVMYLIQTAGFREEEDASTLMIPFSAIWQLNEVAAFHLQSREILSTQKITSLHSKPSCPWLTVRSHPQINPAVLVWSKSRIHMARFPTTGLVSQSTEANTQLQASP